jgi:hypothetical protein
MNVMRCQRKSKRLRHDRQAEGHFANGELIDQEVDVIVRAQWLKNNLPELW